MNQLGTSSEDFFEEQPYGWVIVAVATTCLALGFGINATVAVLIKPFEQEFGWSRTDISSVYSVLTIGAAIGGIFWGIMSDKIGSKKIALLGAFALAFGVIGVSFQNTLWTIYAAFFLIGAIGFSCLFTPLLALTGLWFNKRKGLALGIVTAGGAIGQGVVPFVLRLLITAVGWRDALFYLGVGYLILLLPLIVLLKPPPVLTEMTTTVSKSDDNLWGMSHKITVPWLGLAGIFCCICMAVPLIHLVSLGTDLGFSAEIATSLLLVLMVSGMFGRLFFGALADRIGGLYAYFAASLSQTSVVFLFVQTESLGLLYVLSAIFGFGFAGVMTCLIICAREATPLRITGMGVAIVTTTAWIGMGVGGFQGGYFYDLTGNYTLSYGNAAIAGLINLTITGALILYRRSQMPRLQSA